MMSGTPNLGNGVTPGGMASAAYAPFKQRGGAITLIIYVINNKGELSLKSAPFFNFRHSFYLCLPWFFLF